MCEMLARTVDKAPLDTPDAQARVSQAGDVIAVQDDGWLWSKEERSSPFWIIVQIPGVAAEKMAAYLGSEPGDPLVSRYLRRRAFKFDLGSYDNTKPVDEQTALSLKIAKPAVVDPAVIGDNPAVIG